MRISNSGKNGKLSQLVKSQHNNSSICIKFITNYASDQNSPVEWGFSTIWNYAKTTFHASHVSIDTCYKIFPD